MTLHLMSGPSRAFVLSSFLFAILIGLVACHGLPNDSSQSLYEKTKSEESRLTRLIDDSWQFRLDSSPMAAAYMGKPNNIALDDVSPDAVEQNQRVFASFLTQAKRLSRAHLSQESLINLDILIYELTNEVDYYRFKQHYIPITSESGFHNRVVSHLKNLQLNSTLDAEAYLKALQQVPIYFKHQTNWLTKGLETGLTQPRVVMEGFERSIEAYITADQSKHPLIQPIARLPESIPSKQREQYQRRAEAILTEQVFPAFDALYDFFTETYLPNARETIAASVLPNGGAFYQNRVHYFTSLDMSVDDVHKLGLEEVARIRAEMELIIQEVGFQGSFADFLHFLRTDPQFYAKTAEELLKEAAWIAKQADAQLPKLFKTLPRKPYGVKPVPEEIAPKYTSGRYSHGSGETEAGEYWVNTYALDKRPLYVLEALTLHEAVPGHHLQISLSEELPGLPEFRSYTYFHAYGEGWGLYSEWLGQEMGFYQDPYRKFGRLTYEMWRALRLVVDTGMHAKDWTRQQAVNLMVQNSALSLHNINTEVDRYISWPGQALSYKIGELTIRRLREEAEQQLGELFDVREFHDQVLKNGSVPLSVLEQQINQYIQNSRNQQKQSS